MNGLVINEVVLESQYRPGENSSNINLKDDAIKKN